MTVFIIINKRHYMATNFDQFSKNYREVLNDSVKRAGFDTGYLTNHKLENLRRLNSNICDDSFSFLDYGCGVGNICKEFSKFFPRGHYSGVDQSSKMIWECNSKYASKGSFYELESEGWKQQTYDLIFCACVFHHIPPEKHLSVLETLRSLLNEKGKLIIWEHNPYNPITRKFVNECPFDQDAVLISPQKMKRLFAHFSYFEVLVKYTTFFPEKLSFLSGMEPYLAWLPLGGQYIAIAEKM